MYRIRKSGDTLKILNENKDLLYKIYGGDAVRGFSVFEAIKLLNKAAEEEAIKNGYKT